MKYRILLIIVIMFINVFGGELITEENFFIKIDAENRKKILNKVNINANESIIYDRFKENKHYKRLFISFLSGKRKSNKIFGFNSEVQFSQITQLEYNSIVINVEKESGKYVELRTYTGNSCVYESEDAEKSRKYEDFIKTAKIYEEFKNEKIIKDIYESYAIASYSKVNFTGGNLYKKPVSTKRIAKEYYLTDLNSEMVSVITDPDLFKNKQFLIFYNIEEATNDGNVNIDYKDDVHIIGVDMNPEEGILYRRKIDEEEKARLEIIKTDLIAMDHVIFSAKDELEPGKEWNIPAHKMKSFGIEKSLEYSNIDENMKFGIKSYDGSIRMRLDKRMKKYDGFKCYKFRKIKNANYNKLSFNGFVEDKNWRDKKDNYDLFYNPKKVDGLIDSDLNNITRFNMEGKISGEQNKEINFGLDDKYCHNINFQVLYYSKKDIDKIEGLSEGKLEKYFDSMKSIIEDEWEGFSDDLF